MGAFKTSLTFASRFCGVGDKSNADKYYSIFVESFSQLHPIENQDKQQNTLLKSVTLDANILHIYALNDIYAKSSKGFLSVPTCSPHYKYFGCKGAT